MRTYESVSDDWIQKNLQQAKDVVRQLARLRQQSLALPADRDGSRKLVAVSGVDDLDVLIQTMAPKELTEEQLMASILLGRGLSHEEVALAMELPAGSAIVHGWQQGSAEFRRQALYWRSVSEDEHFGLAIRGLDELARTAENEATRVNIVRLQLALAEKPERRAQWLAEHDLSQRRVKTMEKAVGQKPDDPPPMGIFDMRDADFTAKDIEPTKPEEEDEEG